MLKLSTETRSQLVFIRIKTQPLIRLICSSQFNDAKKKRLGQNKLVLGAMTSFKNMPLMQLRLPLLPPRQTLLPLQLLHLGIAGTQTQDHSCWIQPKNTMKM